MRESKVLAKWNSGQAARFASMGHVLPFFISHAAHNNYDGIWLDLEHRNMDDREVQHLLALGHLYDIDMMVRPPTTMRGKLYRYLEDGAAGFMIPFVSSAEIAREIVSSVKFPPVGNRGLDGAGLDCNFGIDSWREGSTYIQDSIDNTFIVAQIETPEAVLNATEIAAVQGIDLIFLGPGDLQLRLDADPSIDMTIESATEIIKAAADQNGIHWGRTAGSVADLDRFHKMGAKMIPWGGDFALAKMLEQTSKELDSTL